LDFIIEQVTLARSLADRVAAIDAASGVVPLIRCRLREDEQLFATFALLFQGLMFYPCWQESWIDIAKGPPPEFEAFANDLIERCKVAKDLFEQRLSEANQAR
jgi:hypothetical protein